LKMRQYPLPLRKNDHQDTLSLTSNLCTSVNPVTGLNLILCSVLQFQKKQKPQNSEACHSYHRQTNTRLTQLKSRYTGAKRRNVQTARISLQISNCQRATKTKQTA